MDFSYDYQSPLSCKK